MLYSIVDIETTGNSPKDYKVIEIAIIKHNGISEIDRFQTFVNPEERISPFISRLTGITQDDVREAPKFYEIAKEIVEFTADTIFVAHNVSFDYGVIKKEFRRLGFDFRRNHLCTVQTSKILLPGYASYGLKNITKDLGIELNNHHRAIADTEATAELFQILYNKDKENELQNFIKKEIDPKALHPQFDIDAFEAIKNKVGIYKLFDENFELLYIGKSIHIKKRIEQHLRNNKTKKGLELRERIVHVKMEETGSELIALLLESQEIKQHQPYFNRSQRKNNFTHGLFSYEDQNGYLNLALRKSSEDTNSIMLFNGLANGKKYMEYYTNAFQLCPKLTHLQETNGPCFSYGIDQCDGACIGKESPDDYNQKVAMLLHQLNFKGESFLILDKGRNKNEYGFVYVQKGVIKGFGFAMRYLIKRNPNNFKKNLIKLPPKKDFHTIVQMQLNKKDYEIIPLTT